MSEPSDVMPVGNPHTKSYASLHEMPPEVLASRIVGSLILEKGNLNKYDAIIASAISMLHTGFKDELTTLRAELAEAKRNYQIIRDCVRIDAYGDFVLMLDEPHGNEAIKLQFDAAIEKERT